MSKLIELLSNPAFAKALTVVIPIVLYILGVGESPFSDLASFQAFIAAHLPQLGGLTIVVALLWQIVKSAHDRVTPDGLSNALNDGKLDLSDIINVITDGHGVEAGVYVKSALADGAFITLFHACDFDKELTGKLNETHAMYRTKRVLPEAQSV
jgi:hypothetical protein